MGDRYGLTRGELIKTLCAAYVGLPDDTRHALIAIVFDEAALGRLWWRRA